MTATLLFETLLLPRGAILALSQELRLGLRPPVVLWIELAAIAVAGSLAYGASLALAGAVDSGILPVAARFTAAAALAWLVFLPVLALALRQPVAVALQACLVSMAYGEGVLLAGAAANVLAAAAGGGSAGLFGMNILVVLAANAAMAAGLVSQLSALRFPPAACLALWIVVLNGAGAVLFLLLLPPVLS